MNGSILLLGALIGVALVLIAILLATGFGDSYTFNRRRRMNPIGGGVLIGVYLVFAGAIRFFREGASPGDPATGPVNPGTENSFPAMTEAIVGSNVGLLQGALIAALEYAVYALALVTLLAVWTNPRVSLTRELAGRVPLSSLRAVLSDLIHTRVPTISTSHDRGIAQEHDRPHSRNPDYDRSTTSDHNPDHNQ